MHRLVVIAALPQMEQPVYSRARFLHRDVADVERIDSIRQETIYLDGCDYSDRLCHALGSPSARCDVWRCWIAQVPGDRFCCFEIAPNPQSSGIEGLVG